MNIQKALNKHSYMLHIHGLVCSASLCIKEARECDRSSGKKYAEEILEIYNRILNLRSVLIEDVSHVFHSIAKKKSKQHEGE